jgi:hypothetical protein
MLPSNSVLCSPFLPSVDLLPLVCLCGPLNYVSTCMPLSLSFPLSLVFPLDSVLPVVIMLSLSVSSLLSFSPPCRSSSLRCCVTFLSLWSSLCVFLCFLLSICAFLCLCTFLPVYVLSSIFLHPPTSITVLSSILLLFL